MNVESSFLKDRPPTNKELQNLSTETPYLRSPGRYEDLFSLDAAECEEIPTPEKFYSSLKRWTFRLN
jgi:hypothetical protein